MNQIIVDLFIGKEEWLKIYKGQAKFVYVTSPDGRSIKFPANILSKYTTHNGIEGSFAINFDEGGKFQSIIKL